MNMLHGLESRRMPTRNSSGDLEMARQALISFMAWTDAATP